MVMWALVGGSNVWWGSSPPALLLATGLPQYKPYETDDSDNILNFFNTICIRDHLPSSCTESYQSFIAVRVKVNKKDGWLSPTERASAG